MIQIYSTFMSCLRLNVQGTAFNISHDSWQTTKTTTYLSVSKISIQNLSVDVQLIDSLQLTEYEHCNENSNIPIFKYFLLCSVIPTVLNWFTEISCNPGGLVSVYQDNNGKLPSPWNRVTIASLCLGNVITIATASEFKALFLNYWFDQ